MRSFAPGLFAFVLLFSAAPEAHAIAPELPPNLATDPEAQGFADLLFARGMVELADKNYGEALPLFERAASAWPRDATYAYFAAICRLRLSRLDEAIASLRATLPPASNRVAESRVRYDLGEAQYRKGDLSEAETSLRTSLRLDDGDAWAHYYLGLTLFSSGRAGEAIEHFGRARSLDRTLGADGAYYLGIAAYESGDLAAARKRFEEVLGQAPDPGLAASSRDWIVALSERAEAPAPPRGEIRVGIAAEYDDNPAQLSDLVFFPPSESDWRGVLHLRAGAQPWIQSSGGATLGLVLNGYASRHQEQEELDLEGAQGIVQLAYGSDPLGYVNGPLGYARTTVGSSRFAFLVQIGSSYFNLDGESFRRNNEGAASFIVREGGFGKTQLDVHYDDLHFFDPFLMPILNGHTTTIGASQYFALGKPDRTLRLGLSRGSSTAELEDLAKDTTRALVELALPIGDRLTVFVFAARAKDTYDEETFFVDATRTELAGTLVVALGDHFYATARYSWLEREVDPEFFSFDRTIGSAGVTWHW